MAYKKPLRPAFVVAADKVDEFRAKKPDPEKVEKMKRMAELFKKINLKENPQK